MQTRCTSTRHSTSNHSMGKQMNHLAGGVKMSSCTTKRKKRKDSRHQLDSIKMNSSPTRHRQPPATHSALLLYSTLLLVPLIIQLQLECDTRGLVRALQTTPSSSSNEDLQALERQRFLAEPSDTVALIGQSEAQLTCLVANKRGPLKWFKNDWLDLSHEAQMKFEISRYSIEISAHSPDDWPDPTNANATTNATQQLQPFKSLANYTLKITNVSLQDDAEYNCEVLASSLGADDDLSGGGGGAAAAGPRGNDKIVSRKARLEVVEAPTSLEITGTILSGDNFEEATVASNNNVQLGHQVDSSRSSSSSSSAAASSSWSSSSQSSNGGDDDDDDDHQHHQRPITRIIVRENERLKLECKANQAKPRAELSWFDGHNHKVPKLMAVAVATGNDDQHMSSSAASDSIAISAANGTSQFAEELVHIEPEAPRMELATLVWSFKVQRHHHNQILTCQAHHKAFRLPGQPRAYLERKVQLEVQFKPSIEGLHRNETIEGQPVKFSCPAHARPNLLSYSWLIDDQPVEGANKSTLVVQQLTRQLHMREIRCVVSNSVGNSSIVQRLSVKYSPAYVTHLLPLSLQPELNLLHNNRYPFPVGPSHHHHQQQQQSTASASAAKLASKQTHQIVPAISASQLVLAQQLATGHKEGADVTLRCDFDSNPRPTSIEWFRLGTDYDTMIEVPPEASDELIERGANGRAVFRLAGELEQQPVVMLEALAGHERQQKRHIDWDLQPPPVTANQLTDLQLDYEQMSEALLSVLSFFGTVHESEVLNGQSISLINGTLDRQVTQTSAKITEPLGWMFRPSTPAGNSRRPSASNNSARFLVNQYQVLENNSHRPPSGAGAGQAGPEQDEEPLMLMSTSQAANSSKLNHRQAQLTSSQLTIRRFNADQTGQYICRANGERPFQSAARGIYLVVRQRPRIISSSSQWAPLGARQVQVECLAQINTVYDNQTAIIWSRDGKIIKARQSCDPHQRSGGPSSGQEQQQDRCIEAEVKFSPDLLYIRSVLRIHNSNYQDFGQYNCTVTNSFRPDFHVINLQPSAPTGLTFKLLLVLTLASVVLFVLILSSILAFAPCRRLDSLASKSAAIIACSSSSSSTTSGGSASAPQANNNNLADMADTKVANMTSISDPSIATKALQEMSHEKLGYVDDGRRFDGAKSMLIEQQNNLLAIEQQQQQLLNQHQQRPGQPPPNRPTSAFGLDANSRPHQQKQQQLRSSFRHPPHQQQQQHSISLNSSNKFAAIHESLESKLQFGRNNHLIDNYLNNHQQQRQSSQQLESSTAGSETTTTDVSETTTTTNVISLDNNNNNNNNNNETKLEQQTNGHEMDGQRAASFMERIWLRLQQRGHPRARRQAARVINGKSRPTISMPVAVQSSSGSQKSPLSTASNSSSLSLRRSSLSDSLTVVNSHLNQNQHQHQHQHQHQASAVNQHMMMTINNNSTSNGKSSNSRANLMQNSDGLATSCSGSSGRSSSTSNQQNINHHHHNQPTTLSQTAAQYLLQRGNELWPATNGIYANSSPVYTNGLDLSTGTPATSYLADQQHQQPVAWASLHPKQQQSLEQVAVDLNGTGHYQLPLQMMACNEPYQVAHLQQQQHQLLTTPDNNRSCYATICNRPQANNFQLPTTDAGDAFYESNYGTLISKSSAYKTLGYTNSSNVATAAATTDTSNHHHSDQIPTTATTNSIMTSAVHINNDINNPNLSIQTQMTPSSHGDHSSLASAGSSESPNSLTTHANNTSHTNLSSQAQHIFQPAHLYHQDNHHHHQQHVVPQQVLYHPNELSVLTTTTTTTTSTVQEPSDQQQLDATITLRPDGTTATSTLTPNGAYHKHHQTKTNRASPAISSATNQQHRDGLATHV